jgi:hypothetical protein
MVVSALVITLSSDPALRARALEHLAADSRLTLGPPCRDRLPVVAESRSTHDGAALFDALGTADGVVRVDLVSIDFDQEDA